MTLVFIMCGIVMLCCSVMSVSLFTLSCSSDQLDATIFSLGMNEKKVKGRVAAFVIIEMVFMAAGNPSNVSYSKTQILISVHKT